ncbi:hypothetical protein SAMN05660649_01975 [Desulfotomaculum arcticum]|uniref:Uncharacterized protein n=1 Tax=Desulfotruncus arcticus DSM 17038 TaxID=1121424 RepID=A0A1I2SX90_9FIRM|nr:hypothetical protein [Desulfotruncus arcticus]SFG55607.1 hypothetical protein SAMN05660649_01975 [Desulfotomaculum arcticum] [Desulfotruncus arcticus DSM 17038]
MGFFEWYLAFHDNNPILGGLVVPIYMSLFGLAFAVVADVVVRLTGIHLGDYKKEYEEILDEQEGNAKA